MDDGTRAMATILTGENQMANYTCTACNETFSNEATILTHQTECPMLPDEKREYRKAIIDLLTPKEPEDTGFDVVKPWDVGTNIPRPTRRNR